MGCTVQGFEWDAGNREKCQKHGVSLREIELVFQNTPGVYPDPTHSREETRFRAIGKAHSRYVFVVFTLRQRAGMTLIRPISARYMHEQEIRHYEQQQKTS